MSILFNLPNTPDSLNSRLRIYLLFIRGFEFNWQMLTIKMLKYRPPSPPINVPAVPSRAHFIWLDDRMRSNFCLMLLLLFITALVAGKILESRPCPQPPWALSSIREVLCAPPTSWIWARCRSNLEFIKTQLSNEDKLQDPQVRINQRPECPCGSSTLPADPSESSLNRRVPYQGPFSRLVHQWVSEFVTQYWFSILLSEGDWEPNCHFAFLLFECSLIWGTIWKIVARYFTNVP